MKFILFNHAIMSLHSGQKSRLFLSIRYNSRGQTKLPSEPYVIVSHHTALCPGSPLRSASGFQLSTIGPNRELVWWGYVQVPLVAYRVACASSWVHIVALVLPVDEFSDPLQV